MKISFNQQGSFLTYCFLGVKGGCFRGQVRCALGYEKYNLYICCNFLAKKTYVKNHENIFPVDKCEYFFFKYIALGD